MDWEANGQSHSPQRADSLLPRLECDLWRNKEGDTGPSGISMKSWVAGDLRADLLSISDTVPHPVCHSQFSARHEEFHGFTPGG